MRTNRNRDGEQEKINRMYILSQIELESNTCKKFKKKPDQRVRVKSRTKEEEIEIWI